MALFEHVNASGKPNFQGCRIPLYGSKLNLSVWREKLRSYEDRVVVEFLEYGFPLDFDRSKQLSSEAGRNHKGARDYPEFVQKYLSKECAYFWQKYLIASHRGLRGICFGLVSFSAFDQDIALG